MIDVKLEHLTQVHLIELITREDGDVRSVVAGKVLDALAHSIGGALEPIHPVVGLFGSQDIHKSAIEHVELVGLDDVLVERGGVELCEDKDFVDVRVQTIADRDVYDPVFAGKGPRGLAALLR